MEGGSIQNELLKYFSFNSGTISKSAFHQQRCKLLPHTFQFLFQKFNSNYAFFLYCGKYQLLACDGSSSTFTRNQNDIDSYYDPDGRSIWGYNQIHVVALFDLLSKRYCDSVVQPIRKKNEFRALAEMIDPYPHSDKSIPVFIADIRIPILFITFYLDPATKFGAKNMI